MRAQAGSSGKARRGGYTLVEMLIVVVILGISAAMVIPSMAEASSLRVQGVLRLIVADITTAQSDAIAFQSQRAIVFRFNNSPTQYVTAEVSGNAVDATTGLITRRSFGGDQYGNSQITSTTFTNNTLVFDELGGPVATPGSDTPAPSNSITVTGSGQTWRIHVEAYTGRVTIQRL
ncbi:MAG TPA: prepilin-type N-terminal cleavage/methylation domain-containing protein [Phycisphaerales bacterium]|nr:prepilin-type N-terminal cleavage/methylation domain-containing protein [Phycisphaerales bacterium]